MYQLSAIFRLPMVACSSKTSSQRYGRIEPVCPRTSNLPTSSSASTNGTLWPGTPTGAIPWVDRPWIDLFAGLLPAGGAVLDLGCGGGDPVAASLVAHGQKVTGVDASPTLISLCRERMPGQHWVVDDMRMLALGERFDGVLAWDSFFHLKPDDQAAMFAIFAAHSAPGAVLMFNAGPARG
jgi:2-polyprenyl-3-methyl-5-hydroxy-6-metoxy-1,4-benzoquinol methylase